MIRDIDIPVSLCHIRYLIEIVLNKVIYSRFDLKNFYDIYYIYLQNTPNYITYMEIIQIISKLRKL